MGIFGTLHAVFVIALVHSFTSGPFHSYYSSQAHSDFPKFLVILPFRFTVSSPSLVSEWHQAKHLLECVGTIKA